MYSKLPYNSPPTAQNDKPITALITSLRIWLLIYGRHLLPSPLRGLFGQHGLDANLEILATNELALRPTFQL